MDASSGDLMAKHLTDKPNHICKVIQDKGMLWIFDFFSYFFFSIKVLGCCVTTVLRKLSLVFNPADIKAKDQV